MKKFFTLLASLAFSLIAFMVFITVYNKTLDKRIDAVYNEAVARYSGSLVKDQGMELQKRGIAKNNFMLYGSSELASKVPQNPASFFPTENDNYFINIVGRGHSQNLEHSINFGALGKELKGKKVGFIVSIQWFLDKEGIPADSFTMNFSELQFYQYMNNKNIDKESKKYVAERVRELTKGNKKFRDTNFYATLCSKDNAVYKIGYYAFKPYYFIREQILNTKDKTKSLQLLKEMKPQSANAYKLNKGDWAVETKLAEEMGKKAVTNNEYYIDDNYYNNYIKNRLGELKDFYKGSDIEKSVENRDFDNLLKVCKQLDIKPYFIFMPVNGQFYDYMGLPKEAREKYYDDMEKKAKEYGFETLKMKEKDYEPYFMVDIMHFGWKGWLYVDEKISEYRNDH